MKNPKIRFKGYTDDWEQRKLNQIAEKVTEKNKNNIYNEPLTNSAEMGIISQKDYFDREVVNEENLDGYYVVRDDDFVYNPRVSVTAPVGPINCNRLGRNGVMSPLYTVFRTHNINTMYLEYYFKTTSWHRFMKLNGDSGARFDRFTIGTSQFMEMPIPYPDIEEQGKIGQYFNKLDNFITLYKRKCEETKTLKKYMLQKMFPQNGMNVPEIRFDGFTDAWEQHKLEDVAKYRNGKAHENEIDETGEYIVVNSKFVSTDGMVRKFSNAQNEPLYKNEIAFVLSDVPNGHAIARTFLIDKSNKYTLNQRIAGITPLEKTYPYYLHILMNRNSYFLKFDDGNKQTNLSIKDVMEFKEWYPKYEEQKKIGEYFSNLDHLIILHQQKCDELQNIKKFMLQNMFV